MTRFAATFAVLLTGALVTMVAATQTRPADTPYLPDERGWQIGDMLVSYLCFQSTMRSTVELLASGQLPLAAACDRIHDSALRHHPDYLKHIEISDPAPTVRERIARNLIGHLHSIDGIDDAPSARVRALELELAVLHWRGGRRVNHGARRMSALPLQANEIGP
jgi:hypothetical protein